MNPRSRLPPNLFAETIRTLASYAPMSLASPPAAFVILGSSKARGSPRWSELVASAGMVSRLPWSIAGLPDWSAIVGVGPPLFFRPAGSRSGSVLRRSPVALSKPPGPVEPSPPAPSLLRLYPREMTVPELLKTLPPTAPPFRRVFPISKVALPEISPLR